MIKKLIPLSIYLIVFTFLLLSCNKNDNLDNLSTGKIPIDSFFFSCILDSNTIVEIKSPKTQSGYWEESTTRLHKLNKSATDSVFISYTKGYYDDKYVVKIGFSIVILAEVDTTSNILNLPSQKNKMLKKGVQPFEFLEQGFNYNNLISKYCGFKIEICDLKNNNIYTSYQSVFNNNTALEYQDFLLNNRFEIIDVNELNSGIYKDYKNAWFFKAIFKCKLYNSSNNSETKTLSNGMLNCIF